MVMLAAAKHLTPGEGKAIGIDIWDPNAGRQAAQRLWRNAELEGVSNRIAVQQVDARKMPFADATFDVIFASLSLHHMGGGRKQAAGEMLRVLKPGGIIVIYDVLPVAFQAAQALRALGAGEVERLGGFLLRTLRIRKPVRTQSSER